MAGQTATGRGGQGSVEMTQGWTMPCRPLTSASQPGVQSADTVRSRRPDSRTHRVCGNLPSRGAAPLGPSPWHGAGLKEMKQEQGHSAGKPDSAATRPGMRRLPLVGWAESALAQKSATVG